MQRSHRTRQAGGALILVLALVASVFAGGSARAEEPTPSPSAEATATASPADPETPTETEPTETPDDPGATLSREPLVNELAGGPTTANPDQLVLRRGLSATLDVAANDQCTGEDCVFSLVQKPAGWKVSITSAGLMSIRVPADARVTRFTIFYKISDGPLPPVQGRVTVTVTMDSYNSPSGAVFSHPYRKGYRYKIRTRILRTINSVPTGGRIQLASWSFSSGDYRRALKKARNHGVAVQIVLANRNKANNSDYRRLVRVFGTRVTANGSWVKKCRYSCRGRGGTMHSKIFLFSQSYRTPYVVMTGSANLTDFAVNNQWNQMNTVTKRKEVYDATVRIFNELKADRVANPMYVEEGYKTYPSLRAYYYPSSGVIPSNDFLLKALNRVRCTGATNTGHGRTVIKVAVYAWYQDRGKWLAKRVRQLWQQGCKVQIVYGISSNPVKKILYNPSGRGRIPMRQILLTNTAGAPIYYMHNKWMSIKGRYGGNSGVMLAYQGSFNFSNLGLKSDENFQRLSGWSHYRKFARDFTLLWKDRQARAPSPVSTIPTIEGRYTEDDLRLGTGVYRYMEAD